MKSTEITPKIDALTKELKSVTDYLAIITQERAEQLRISKSLFRVRLTRIRASKEVFRLDLEITAKKQYLGEIEDSIRVAR